MNVIFALGYFTGLAAIFLWRLFPVWNSAIPGGMQDTRLFLWNGWWFHHAVSVLQTNPFHTPMLFHPFGTQLISHDFPLWMNTVTYVGQKFGLSLIAASNLWFLLTWILIGFCTYGLARQVTGHSFAAVAAGTFAMTHSYTLARAMQNWGQFNIYGIALFLWALIRAREKQNWKGFALAGVALAWTAACHYYFLIYCVIVWLAVALIDLSPYAIQISFRSSSPAVSGRGSIRKWFLGASFISALVSLGITFHPGAHNIAGITISMQTPQNAIFVMWLFLIAFGMTYIKASMDPRQGHSGMTALIHHHVLLVATAFVFLSPLFWASLKLVLQGGYPKQSILWKTHLAGANLLSLFMPNPSHALWGKAVSSWFLVRGMNPQEQAASIGWVCLALVIGTHLWKEQSKARNWLLLAATSTIFSMGTHLHIAQLNLWCPLPFFFFRLVPIFGNVRVPERWMALGAIAWSVVLAIAITKLAQKKGWSLRKVAMVVTALLLFENWPGIPLIAQSSLSPLYAHLGALPAGAVLPIPLYIGDSSIGTGNAINGEFTFPWDHLLAQMTHQKPMIGGYVGRISRQIIDSYKGDPFIHTLLDIEENKISSHDPEPAFGAYAVRHMKFRYVLLYPTATTPETKKYVLESLPLENLERSGGIELYRVKENQND